VPETGGTRAADNKWEAVYIMGQVYHSLGKAADAIMQYTKVKQRFTDAAEAIEFFSRKEIRLDEVTTIKPGDAKRVRLSFRNIPDVAIKVYRIDLMKFGLMQRNLDRITARAFCARHEPSFRAIAKSSTGWGASCRCRPSRRPLCQPRVRQLTAENH